MAHRLGLLLSQLAKGSPQRCELQYRGDISQKDTKLLSSSFAAGLLENALEEDVNIVNAEVLMRERGIELNEECCGEKGAFNSLMTATMVSSEGTQRVAGTLFGNNMPRLVQVGEQRLEAYLDGILLVFTHNDVPGIIGHIGTLLGSHNVNIAQMAVGRAHTTPGGAAVGVLNLDNTPPAAAIKELLSAKDILSVDVVTLPSAGKLPDWLVS